MALEFKRPCAVAAAVLAKARWEARDVFSRRSGATAVEFLIAHAAELALSPNACDQLLSVALSEAAHDGVAGKNVLESPPMVFVGYDGALEASRRAVRCKVFQYATDHWHTALHAATIFAESMAVDCKSSIGPTDPTANLSAAALRLQQHLWDHPHIAADSHTRLAMFLSLPMLEARLRFMGEASDSRSRNIRHEMSLLHLLNNFKQKFGYRIDAATRLFSM